MLLDETPLADHPASWLGIHELVGKVWMMISVSLGDFIGRVGIAAYFTYAAILQVVDIKQNLSAPLHQATLYGASEILASCATLLFLTMVVAVTIFRLKPINAAEGWEPRATALGGTFLTVLITLAPPYENLSPGLTLSGTFLVTTGFLLCTYVIYYLGKSFSIMAEARKLVTAGPYAFVRHPLYLSELVALIGIIILHLSLSAIAIGCFQWLLQLRRMQNEERVLKYTFAEYASYAGRTPMVIPSLRR